MPDAPAILARSEQAWSDLLKSFGLRFSRNDVLDALVKTAPPWEQKRPSPLRKTIFNYEDVSAAIKASGIPMLQNMLAYDMLAKPSNELSYF